MAAEPNKVIGAENSGKASCIATKKLSRIRPAGVFQSGGGVIQLMGFALVIGWSAATAAPGESAAVPRQGSRPVSAPGGTISAAA